jgi:hypothetical protein
MLLLADRVDGFGHLPHDMEAVEHDLVASIRQAVTGRADVGLPHVHRHRLERRLLVVGQLGVVGREACGFPLCGHKFHGRALQVADDRVVPMPFAKRLLVDADVADRAGHFSLLPTDDRPLHDAPGVIPTDGRNGAGALDGTALQDQVDHQPFHQQREATPRLRPRHPHLLHAMRRTPDPRNLCVQLRLELARVQMAPRPRLRMIERRQLDTTLRTGPACWIVLQPQLDALVVRLQFHPRDMPRRGDPENRFKQRRILHPCSLLERLYLQDTPTSTRRRAGRPPQGAARAGGLTNHPDPL